MSTKKLIIIFVCLIVLLVIVFGVLIANSSSKSLNKVSKGSSTYVDKAYQKKVDKVEKGEIKGEYETTNKNESYYNLDQEGRNLIDERINYIIDLLNKNDYKTLYSLFTPLYITARFPFESDFKDYLAEINKSNEKYYADSFEVYGKTLYIKIGLGESKKNTFDIKLVNYEVMPGSSEEVVNEYGETNSLKLYFSDVLGIEHVRMIYNNKQVEINIDYLFEYEDKDALIMHVKNKTNEDLRLDFAKTALIETLAGYDTRFNMVTTRYMDLPAGEEKIYEIGFAKCKLSINMFDLHLAIGENVYEQELSFNYASLDDYE